MTEREMARKMAARRASQRKQRNRRIIITICLMLLVCVASIGGTVAWLNDSTTAVENTFTASNIDIELSETIPVDKTAKMVPGHTIEKDPKVTVKANSEKCYVFVEIEESDNFVNFMTYGIADGWTELSANSGIYYRTVDASTADQTFPILKDDQVAVKADVTKANMDAIVVGNQPTLSFTAYAVQYYNSNNSYFTPADAWTQASN